MADPNSAARGATLVVLRGVGQIMFQGHAGTGLCFLAGIALASPWMLLGAVLGAIIGPLTARFGSFDRAEIEQGLYGFNATLVGLATLVFLRPEFAATWALLVGGCAASSVVTYLARRFLSFPTYTGPFVVVTWGVLLIARATAGSIEAASPPPDLTMSGFPFEVLRGLSEVMLGAGVSTGTLFLVGLAISDPRHAALALVGSVVGTAAAHYHGDETRSVALGLYGYNGALAAMALYLRKRSLTAPIAAALVATLLTEFFPKSWGIPALTAPFVVASWILLAVVQAEERLFAGDR